MFGRLLRSLFRLALLAGLAYVIYRLIAGDEAPTGSAPPTGDREDTPREEESEAAPARRPGAGTKPGGARPSAKPSQPGPPARASADSTEPDTAGPTGPPSVRSIGVGEVPSHVQRWVEPADDGSCPLSHPVKGKLESGIFHTPDGRHYERTHADRCYRDAAAAEADGLRPSKQ